MTQLADIVDAHEAGQTWTQTFHKTGVPASITAALWGDMSMGAGNPKYNAYVGPQGEFTPLTGAGNDGIFVGPSTSLTRYLVDAMIQPAATPGQGTWVLADYLGFYALLDGDSTDQQDMVNSAPLPRYDGGMVALVCAAPMAQTGRGVISYTNSDGVAGRSATFGAVLSSNAGMLVSAQTNAGTPGSRSPWITLQDNDKGVRSIEAVTFTTPPGGFMHAVIMRPLMTMTTWAASIVSEYSPVQGRGVPIEVKPGAYLNWLCLSGSGTLAAPFRGSLKFVWC